MKQILNHKDHIEFQSALWKLIEITLNSYLPTPSNRRKFKSLQNKCIDIIEKQTGEHCTYHKNRCTAISYLYKKYRDLFNGLSLKKGKTTTIHFTSHIDYEEYDRITASFLERFENYTGKYLTPHAIGVFLHGSLATNDYTGFSDVDAGIFVKDEVMLNPKLLKKLQYLIKGALRLILKYDNLQHHGLFIIPEGFLYNYPEEYLPVDVFKYSKTIGRSFQIKVNSKKDIKLAREKLLEMSPSSATFLQQPRNLYELKHKLSMFMLLPTLYLQAKGEYVYKKFSFEKAKKHFPKKWWAIDEISNIRTQWSGRQSVVFSTFVSISPSTWLPSLIYRMITWHIPNSYSKRYIKKLTNGINELSSLMVARILE